MSRFDEVKREALGELWLKRFGQHMPAADLVSAEAVLLGCGVTPQMVKDALVRAGRRHGLTADD